MNWFTRSQYSEIVNDLAPKTVLVLFDNVFPGLSTPSIIGNFGNPQISPIVLNSSKSLSD